MGPRVVRNCYILWEVLGKRCWFPVTVCSQQPMSHTPIDDEARVATMLETVQWDILAAKACRLLQAGNARWGEHTRGAYNLVRFLHLDDTVIVARVPLEWEMSPMAAHRMESEIATMEYVREHTKIPIPRVLDYNTSGEDIGVPYMLMS